MGIITKLNYKTREEWLELRKSLDDRLGGSELGVAAGHSPYSSPYALYCEKCGFYETEDISQKEAIIQGHDLEGYVAERFTKATNKKVHEELCIFTNSDAPHLKASIDRKLDNEDSGLECKTVKDIVMRKFSKGDFPQSYYDQCACYLKVTELKRWYLAMLVFGTDFKIFMMTTIKDEADRYAELKAKVVAQQELTDEESKEWVEKYNYLEACYYIDQEELDSCEVIASDFMARVNDFRNGNVDAWPLSEIDSSEATKKALRKSLKFVDPSSVVTFDEINDYGVQNDGNVYVGAKREDVVAIAKRRQQIADLIKQLEEEKSQCENQMRLCMKDKETFKIPGFKITCKMGTARRFAQLKKVEEYFEAQNIPVPEGMISESEPTREVRFWPHKAKK